MSRLTRDGTAEPVSRDQILRHARGQGNIIFPVQLTTSRIGNLTRLIHTLLYVMTIHTVYLYEAVATVMFGRLNKPSKRAPRAACGSSHFIPSVGNALSRVVLMVWDVFVLLDAS